MSFRCDKLWNTVFQQMYYAINKQVCGQYCLNCLKSVPTVFWYGKLELSWPDAFLRYFDLLPCHSVTNVNENTLKLGFLQQLFGKEIVAIKIE